MGKKLRGNTIQYFAHGIREKMQDIMLTPKSGMIYVMFCRYHALDEVTRIMRRVNDMMSDIMGLYLVPTVPEYRASL